MKTIQETILVSSVKRNRDAYGRLIVTISGEDANGFDRIFKTVRDIPASLNLGMISAGDEISLETIMLSAKPYDAIIGAL